MACLSERKIQDYLQDALSEREYEDARRHLEQCRFCKTSADGQEFLSSYLNQMGKLLPPGDLSEKIYSRAKQEGILPLDEPKKKLLLSALAERMAKKPSMPKKEPLSTRSTGKPSKKSSVWMVAAILLLVTAFFGSIVFHYRYSLMQSKRMKQLLEFIQTQQQLILKKENTKTPPSAAEMPAASPAPPVVTNNGWKMPAAAGMSQTRGEITPLTLPLRPLRLQPQPTATENKHLHLPAGAVDQLFKLLKELNIQIEYDDAQSFMVLSVPKESWDFFLTHCLEITGTRDFTGRPLPEHFAGDKVSVSVYLDETS